MANELWVVTCECGAVNKLEDSMTGDCEVCGKPVEYKNPEPKKGAKPKPLKKGAAAPESDIERGVGTFKYTGK